MNTDYLTAVHDYSKIPTKWSLKIWMIKLAITTLEVIFMNLSDIIKHDTNFKRENTDKSVTEAGA